MSRLLPRFPVFIPTRGRVGRQLSAKMFDKGGVPFRLVVEAEEADVQVKDWGSDRVLVLPESGRGLVFSRNWIKDFSIAEGHAFHWQFDDDVRSIRRLHDGYRIRCDPGTALSMVEDFVGRYENVAMASLNSWFFVPTFQGGFTQQPWPVFYLNARCYTDFLVNNSVPNKWRYRYNEDTDMSLQVLCSGWCTMLFNVFLIETPATLTSKGGQMVSPSGSYQGDGRLHMARELERVWPHVVETRRRFHRPQHFVKDHWKKFDNKLRLKSNPPPVRKVRLKILETAEVQSEPLRDYVEKERKK